MAKRRNKSQTKVEATKTPGTRASPRTRGKVEAEAEQTKAAETKEVKTKETKNNKKPPPEAKVSEAKNTPKGKKKGKAAAAASTTKNNKAEEVKTKVEEPTETEVEKKNNDNSPKENQEEKEVPVNSPKGRGRPAKKSTANTDKAAKASEVVSAPEETPPAVAEEKPPVQAGEKTEKHNALPTRTSARGRIPKTIVDPSEDVTVNKRPGRGKGANKKTGKKRKSTSKTAPGEAESKPKAARKSTNKKAAAAAGKAEKQPVVATVTTLPAGAHVPTVAATPAAAILTAGSPAGSGEKGSIQVAHIIEEQVVSPQILDAGSSAGGVTTNGIPVLHASDLLLSESSPHRFTKMITQPSQELPAEIFQNEQTVTVTSPQKSPKVLKLVLGPQGLGATALQQQLQHQGVNPVKGPAVIVRQNSAAGDAGNPDQITCLNVFNGSPRRSVTGNDSNGETEASTSDARPGGDSEDTAVRFYNPSSPGKLVGEGLHNYCKSPLLAPAGTFPPSPPSKKLPASQVQHNVPKQSSENPPPPPEKKSRKRTVSAGVVEVPEKSAKKAVTPTPAPAPVSSGPGPTRRSSRGTAGKPPKRESMVEIPIVNKRRSSSTNSS